MFDSCSAKVTTLGESDFIILRRQKTGLEREREREIRADLRDIHREGGVGGCEAELLEFAHGGRGFREREWEFLHLVGIRGLR